MAATDDDGFEYVTGTFKYKKGSTPDQSRENPDAWRGTLRDGDGHLSGHGEFIPGGEDGRDYEGQPDPEPVYIFVNSDQTASQEDETRVEHVVAALAVLGIIVAATQAAPHVQRWWIERAVPFMKSTRTRLSRSRKLDSHVGVAESSAVAEPAPTEASQEVFVALNEYRLGMSSAEARERFVQALVARIFSDEQIRILRNARIEDGSGALELASAVDTLTPQQLGESITLMLEANPSWPDEETLAELGKIVGVSRDDAEPVPMRRKQIKKALRLPRREA